MARKAVQKISKNRVEVLSKLESEKYDLLVIGGGITGVGIALDAQTRGLKTALVEMQDFASGSSSRSTKLIHGGLRYLKQFEFGLVNRIGRERAIVHHIAPHLVHPDKMLLPLVKGGNFGKWLTSIGLALYDWLAGVRKSERRRMLSFKGAIKAEPLLNRDKLEGAGYYAEYRTDDSRLVIGIAKTAMEHGARLVNYVRATEFLNLNGKVSGIKVLDEISGKEFFIHAKKIVNACGPWVDEIRAIDGSLSGKKLHLTKGVHIVVDKKKLPLKQTVYFDNDDKRMLFAIPRGKFVYLGTTDTHYKGDIANPLAEKSDVEYILKACNSMFPSAHLQIRDVQSAWAGLRPLIHEEGKTLSEISRKDEIFISESGLITIAGGKLTGYRLMAEKVVNLLAKKMERNLEPCLTENLQITGGEFDNYQSVQLFVDEILSRYSSIIPNRLDAEYLVYNYGRDTEFIAQKAVNMELEPDLAIAISELEYSIDNEMVARGVDFFERRTGRINFGIQSITKIRSEVMAHMATRLNWSSDRLQQENSLLNASLKKVNIYGIE